MRPWVAIVIEIKNGMVKVQWLKKDGPTYVPHIFGGKPYISDVPEESIMFSNVLENISATLDSNEETNNGCL